MAIAASVGVRVEFAASALWTATRMETLCFPETIFDFQYVFRPVSYPESGRGNRNFEQFEGSPELAVVSYLSAAELRERRMYLHNGRFMWSDIVPSLRTGPLKRTNESFTFWGLPSGQEITVKVFIDKLEDNVRSAGVDHAS